MSESSVRLTWTFHWTLGVVSVLTLLNSAGFMLLLLQTREFGNRMDEVESHLEEISQSSVVEFMTEMSKNQQEVQEDLPQYSRNKRSQELKEAQTLEQKLQLELEEKLDEVSGDGIVEELLRTKEKNIQEGPDFYHRTVQHDGLMMMMTYSMVPVRNMNDLRNNSSFNNYYYRTRNDVNNFMRS